MARIKTLRRLSVAFSALTAFAVTSDETSWGAATQLFSAIFHHQPLQVGFAVTIADYGVLARSLMIAIGAGLSVSFILKTLHIVQRQNTHDLVESLEKLRLPLAKADPVPAFTVSRIADAHLEGMTESYAVASEKNMRAPKYRAPRPVKLSLGEETGDSPMPMAARR